MGGFVAAELALSFATRVERLVLVSAAGLSIEHARREPLLVGARVWAGTATWLGARGRSVVTRPRMRRLGLQMLVRYPEKLSPQLTYELTRGAGTPGFVPAMRALLSYGFRDQLAQIEVPTLVVWGRNDMLVPRGDAREFVRLIGAQRPARDVRRHRPPLDARAPVTLQPAARGVRGRRAGAGGRRGGRERLRARPAPSSRRSAPRRGHAQRVTAPSAALETSLAYLASTPVPDSPLSGAS